MRSFIKLLFLLIIMVISVCIPSQTDATSFVVNDYLVAPQETVTLISNSYQECQIITEDTQENHNSTNKKKSYTGYNFQKQSNDKLIIVDATTISHKISTILNSQINIRAP